MALRISVFALAAVLAGAPVSAQVRADEPAGAQFRPVMRPRPAPIGFRAFGHYEQVSMTASKTFDAVLGTREMKGRGAGGEVIRLWRGLFGRVALSQMSDTGSRAFIVDQEPISLNIPLEVTVRTLEFGGGWRVIPRRMPRLSYYGGAGLLRVKLEEKSSFAQPGENTRASFNGYSVFAGVEVGVWKWIFAGVEGQYRMIPDALGEDGISKAYNETDLGGAAVRVLFGVRK